MNTRKPIRLILAAMSAFVLAQRAQAATYYWDNLSGAGFGSAGGTWAAPTLNQWNTSNTGADSGLQASYTTSTNTLDAINFGTATAGYGLGAGTIMVSGTVDATTITFGSQSGQIVLSGGTIRLGPGLSPSITVNNTTDTISSSLTVLGTRLTKAGTGELVLSGSNTMAANVRHSAGKITLTGSITHSVNQFQVGFGSGNTAIMDISGTGSLTSSYNNARAIVVGGGAGVNGTLNLSGSSSVSTPGMMIGEDAGGTGLFNQTGGTTIASQMWMVGNSSTLNVSGGSFTSTGQNYLAAAASVLATTTINVNGTGSMTLGTLNFGQGGRNYTSLTVNVGNGSAGGTFQVSNIVYGGGTGASAINFDGGTFVANGTFSTPAAVPVAGATFSTVVKSGGAKIDVTGTKTNTIQTALTDGGGNGGLTKLGTGTLALSGTNTFSGVTSVQAGTLSLTHTNALPATMDVYITSGATVNLSTGTHVIRKLFIDGTLQSKKLLNAVNRPGILSGPGSFYPTQGTLNGTLIRVN